MFNKRKSSPEGFAQIEAPPPADIFGLAVQSPPPALRTGDNRMLKSPAITALPSADKPSIVSEGFTIIGELRSNGTLLVEGKVSGTLVAHSVNISATGEVQGEITCTALNIKGLMMGNVVCDELVVASSAHVLGSISYKLISIGSGATIKGDLNHITG